MIIPDICVPSGEGSHHNMNLILLQVFKIKRAKKLTKWIESEGL
jgi:hypothetical protein